jgi:hypothetical protein
MMTRVIGALIGAWIAVGLAGCGALPAPPTSARPVPSERAIDSCAELTAADVTEAIAALPGWSYDVWSASETVDGTAEPGLHSRVEYVAPDRLRDVSWDARGAPRGSIIIGDESWVYTGFQAPSAFDPADFPSWLERLFPFKGSFITANFPFDGGLPGAGLRESDRVPSTECLAVDPSTGVSLVTTRAGQLVRMTLERRSANWIETKTLTFRAAMPPAIEPPAAEELRPKKLYP